MRDVGLKNGAEIGSARCGVAHERDFAKANHHFGKKGLIQTLPGGSESGCRWRVRMAHRLNIFAHLIKEKMHSRFRGNLAVTVQVSSTDVRDDKITGGHHAFVETGGSSENAISIETNGKIPFASDNVTAFIKPAADHTNVVTMLFLRARREVSWRVRRHSADSFLGLDLVPSR